MWIVFRICCVFLTLCVFTSVFAAEYLQGRVYEGSPPDESTPLANVTVNLYGSEDSESMGSIIASTTTNSEGWYGFDIVDLSSEFYTIEEVNPGGYTSIDARTVGGTVIDNDHIRYAHPLNRKTITGNKFWDEPEETNTAPVADAGGPYTGTVGQPVTLDGSASYDPDAGDSIVSYLWDLDHDGQYDDASGVTVQHTWYSVHCDTVVLMVTDTHGSKDSDKGTYCISEAETGGITGTKWHDFNENGVIDGGEPTLSGWTIYIDQNQNESLDSGEPSQQTDNNGEYSLQNLAAGEYQVREVEQSGWSQTYPTSGYHLIQLQAGEWRDGIDFGNKTTEQEPDLDFGDAPSPYDASRSFKIHTRFYLGAGVDNETGHQPHPQALGDDQDGNDDEDGVSLTSSLVPGQTASLEAILTVSSDIAEPVFTVLVDFDGNGHWTLDERVIQETATHGTHTFSFPVPQSATTGTTFMRAVLRDEGPAGPQGYSWGEIEDYQIDITQTEEVYDFGDAPDAYETYYNFGPYHSRTRGFCLGTSIDGEQDGQPTAMADGDDKDGTDDEDGVTFPLLQAGSPASVQIQVSAPLQQTVQIACWIDYDQNQTFDSGELVVHDYRNLSSSPETITYMVPVPPSLTGDSTYARVRLFMGDDYEPLPTNFGGDGEVEDYVVYIASEDDALDFGDAPTPYPPASHVIGGGWIGNSTDTPDRESGMQRHAQALGDDQDADGDDEMGFLYISDLVPGNIGLVYFKTWTPPSTKTSMCVWMDWNQDGDWSDANENVGCIVVDNSVLTTPFETTIAPAIYIPPQAKTGPTFARIRLVNRDQEHQPLSPGGHYISGEVEDHLVIVKDDGDNIPEGSTLIGYKWNDLDGDGYWDQNPTPEPPLANWSIWLDENGNGVQDVSDPVVQTDANGFYHFDNLPDGTYTVGEEQQPGWTQTYPAGGGTHSIAVAVGHMIQAANFGNTQQETEPSTLKWSQIPLFDPMLYDTTCYFGWDELSIFPSDLAADDWFCFNPKPVTGIRWWGSYKYWDESNPPEDAPVEFHLGIWTDVPRGEDPDYSHPGKLIWETYVPRSAVNEHEVRCDFHPDHMQDPETCFLYEWSIPKEDWFFQEEDSTVYWLSVSAIYPEDMELKHPWGWTTRMHYFNDDALVLNYNHPIEKGADFEEGEPIASRRDLAFELMTTEYEWNLDYGDAPDPTFGTSRVYNGAHHLIDPAVRLGDQIDTESDGLPSNQADGDDSHNLDDDDGVRLLSGIRAGETAELQVDVSTAGVVNIWLDTEGNGHWFDPPDHVVDNVFLSAGEHKLEIPIPGTAHIGEVYMRVRFSTYPGVWFYGFARDGEVEDYLVEIESSGTAVEGESNLPTDYALYPNIPNPFNLSTRLEYDLPTDSPVRLAICNLVGQEIAVLVDQTQTAGHHSAVWNGLDRQGRPLPTGIYFCTLRAGDFKATQKLLLLK